MLKIFFLFFIVTTSSYTVEFISVENLLKKDSSVTYTKWHSPTRMNFKKFPIASSQNSTYEKPFIPESFVLTLQSCKVFSHNGIIIIDDHTVITELIWPWSTIRREKRLTHTIPYTIEYISGKVAIIAQEGCYNYYHWMTEILPKIIMLEELNITYDWLYVPTLHNFMKETLQLLNIDLTKIITAKSDSCISAGQIIAPSFVSQSCYSTPWIAEGLRKKFLPLVKTKQKTNVFISRQNAAYRRIVNEDELFTILEKKGFKKYHLEEMSFLDQVELFHNAKTIVAAHGAGLTNILFAEPGTKIYELFQEHEDDAFWYLSQLVKLDHTCIKTTEFKKGGGYNNTLIPEDILQFFTNLKM